MFQEKEHSIIHKNTKSCTVVELRGGGGGGGLAPLKDRVASRNTWSEMVQGGL